MNEKKTRAYWLHALSPLHVGTGRGVSYIDLPIMREKTTNWPLVPGSAVKGVIADHWGATKDAREKNREKQLSFGRAGDEHSNSGSLVFTDARLVCLPVRSFFGTFAWCTSIMALSRLKRDLENAGLTESFALPKSPDPEQARVPDEPSSVIRHTDKKVYFEDLDFSAVPCPVTAALASQLAQWIFPKDPDWQQAFRERFAILPNDVFDFLTETGTEVNTRVRIDEARKTVADGALWTEESLPAETILSGLVWCDRVFGKKKEDEGITPGRLIGQFCGEPLSLQMGGKATVGKGQMRCCFAEKEAAHA